MKKKEHIKKPQHDAQAIPHLSSHSRPTSGSGRKAPENGVARARGPYRDKFERFLSGYITARFLCQACSLQGLANELLPILYRLQTAHDRIVNREARGLVLGIIRAVRQGRLRRSTLSAAQLKDLLQLEAADLNELIALLDRE
jgi:hypothetical protein